MKATPNDLGLVLTGGGARAAYQAGVLRYASRLVPDLKTPVLTGVSAGAINAAFLGCHTGTFKQKCADLVDLWARLRVDDVFDVGSTSLFRKVLFAGLKLTFLGQRKEENRMRGLVDSAPLRRTLTRALNAELGKLAGIDRNLRKETLRAVALVTTNYATGQTITWCQGQKIDAWTRPNRRAVLTTLSVEHVMASAALPLFFPAIALGNDYFGDGGVRLTSPLAPAIHLGARRLLVVSNRYDRNQSEADRRTIEGYPPPAAILGALLNAVFLDALDQDVMFCQRINRLLESGGEIHEAERDLKPVDLFVVRPSTDLGQLARDFEPEQPLVFRTLTRRWGTRESKSGDLLSLVLFQKDYVNELVHIGERDAAARRDELEEFLRR